MKFNDPPTHRDTCHKLARMEGLCEANVKQRFLATLPGGVLAVLFWLSFSYLLGFYFRHIANFSRTYGTLGGFIAFMTWFYWNSFALLVGAELNAELGKESAKGSLPQKDEATEPDRIEPAA